jgi:ADP-ribose pyrophosphatase
MSWRVITTKKVLEDQWISVRADTCLRADGSVVAPYYVIEGKDWCNVTAVTPSGHTILVREYRHAFGRTLVGLPGGLIDPDDPSPEQAAVRELAEEVGITKLISTCLLASMVVNPSTHTNVGYSFLAIVHEDSVREVRSIEPEIEVVIKPFTELLMEVIDGNSLFSGYDAASILRAGFRLMRLDMPISLEIRKVLDQRWPGKFGQ